MNFLPGWERHVVRQKRPNSGCVPTGFEILLRFAAVEGINFDTFQDDFDFDKDLEPGKNHINDFQSISHAVNQRYPKVNICFESFTHGEDKLYFIENYLSRQQPILLSLSLAHIQINGWHIMVIIGSDQDNLLLFKCMDKNNKPEVISITKKEIIKIHNQYSGGKDVAYLESTVS